MIGKHGFIFGIGQHGEILSSLCGKHLPTNTYITLIHHGTMVAISITACPLFGRISSLTFMKKQFGEWSLKFLEVLHALFAGSSFSPLDYFV